jgi:hypothetical protein
VRAQGETFCERRDSNYERRDAHPPKAKAIVINSFFQSIAGKRGETGGDYAPQMII